MKATQNFNKISKISQLKILTNIVTCSTCNGHNFKTNMTQVGNGYICNFCLADPDEPLNIVITKTVPGGNDVSQ